MKTLLLTILILFFLIAPVYTESPIWNERNDKVVSQSMRDVLAEVNENFTYNGQPIHPGLVQEFECWLSDKLPITTTVDVAAAWETNEYYEDDVKRRGDFIQIQKKIEGDTYGRVEYYEYKWLGKLDNGLHVLDTLSWGGGSGVFEHLIFVKFDIGQGLYDDGTPYERLLMSVVREYTVGDRDDGEITVLPDRNQIILGESRYREEPVVLEFE